MKLENINDENKGAAVYVGSSLTVHNPFFFFWGVLLTNMWVNKLMRCFCDVRKFKMIGMHAIERCARSGLKKLTKPNSKEVWSVGFHNYSTLLTMLTCNLILKNYGILKTIAGLFTMVLFASTCIWTYGNFSLISQWWGKNAFILEIMQTEGECKNKKIFRE